MELDNTRDNINFENNTIEKEENVVDEEKITLVDLNAKLWKKLKYERHRNCMN